MYRVLHVMGGACYGGISAVVLNYYSNMDRGKIHFDIAVTDKYIGRNARLLEELGCKIFPICLKSENRRLYESQIGKLLREGNYDAIHVHGNDTSWFTLRLARRAGMKVRIAHAHTAGHLGGDSLRFRIRQSLCQFLNRHYSTNLISCGRKAGEYMYGKRGTEMRKHFVLPNAVDTALFSFKADVREKMRNDMGLDQYFVVGMIGRVDSEKNPIQGIQIFDEIRKRIPNARLLMVGSGECLEKVRAEVDRLGLNDDVLFLGHRSDVNDLYQALDLYLLPSLYEGFPVAAVEAMATGLPCLISDRVTDELSFGKLVRYLPLNDNKAWGKASEEFLTPVDRSEGLTEIRVHQLDIRDSAKTLENFYLGK